MKGPRTVSAEIDLAAPVDAVWRAWTTAEGLSGWLVDELQGEMRQGKRVGFVWRDLGATGALDVLTADEPRRLSLAQHRPGAPADVLEIQLGARGERTSLRLSQAGFIAADPEAEAEAASSGWRIALEVLRARLEAHPDQPRASITRVRKTGLALPQVVPWLLTRGGRAMWLPAQAQGEPRLLTTREALLSWPEASGLIEAKVFPGGPRETVVALRAHSWTRTREDLEKHAPAFDAALEKLESLAAGKR